MGVEETIELLGSEPMFDPQVFGALKQVVLQRKSLPFIEEDN